MKLFIAEKPSLGRAIAEQLGIRVRHQSHIECAGGAVVTWCFGHLLEQAPPEAYSEKWKRWDEASLPITVTGDNWKLVPRKQAAGQIHTIKSLLRDAKSAVNAGDPGREGQLLVDEVLEFAGWRGPTQRLLLNATDPANVKKALSKMDDNAKFINLLNAAKCRQRADWLVGMNLSRAVTVMLSQASAVPIGRVQTPTLGLVVKRDLEIAGFASKPFYTLTAHLSSKSRSGEAVQLQLRHDSPDPDIRITDEGLAKSICKLLEGKDVRLSVQTSKVSNLAPLPSDLADFQREAEMVLGWGAAKSLGVLQELYEGKLTTYPRTECRYLPSEQAGDAGRIAATAVRFLSPALNEAQQKWVLSNSKPSPRIYDSTKVGEHHGIIPTGVPIPSSASKDMQAAYALVCRRFLQSLMPDHIFEQTIVSFVAMTPGLRATPGAGGEDLTKRVFQAKGALEGNRRLSWKVLVPPPKTPKPEDAQAILPPLADQSPARIDKVSTAKGKTTPPKPYTEATLIADMRQAAKFVTDPKMKSILKETTGIGTAATQAATIERLKAVGFLEVSRRNLVSTELGREVIGVCPPAMYDIGVTAAWECALADIAVGQYKPEEFMRRIDLMVQARIEDVKKKRAQGGKITARSKPELAARQKEATKRMATRQKDRKSA